MLIDAATADGHAWQMPVCARPDDHATLYWIPALGVPAAKYRPWALALQAQRVGVVVHEWRGIGSSNWRAARGRDWNYSALLDDDIAAGVAAAQAALPASRWLLGGHSLGGQFAALALGRAPHRAHGLVLVATGVPHARTFTGPTRWLVAGFARTLVPLTALCGYFPGHRLRWAGREAAGVMRDWAKTVRTGDYRSAGLAGDPESELARVDHPTLDITFTDDRLVPPASMAALLGKLGTGPRRTERFDHARLGTDADHFRWMRHPDPVARELAAWARTQFR